MLERTISVARTAKYYQFGEITETTENIWFVCHGYAQLAKDFIQSFECIHDERTVIVAPEALSRFYTNGFTGQVGASWMTSVERLSEIDDYVAYLDALYQKVTAGHDVSSVKLTALGFSQGVSTAARWVVRGNMKTSRLVLWAGTPPKELDSKKALEPFTKLELIYVYGTKDKLVQPSKLVEVKRFFEEKDVGLNIRTFDGGHRLDEGILMDLKN